MRLYCRTTVFNKWRFASAVRAISIACLTTLPGATISQASSHREAPYVSQHPKVDATDFYLFNSYESGRQDYVTLIANYLPLQDPYGGPNYFNLDPNALYEIHIDNDGDAKEDITFSFQFTEALTGSSGVALTIGDEQVEVPLKAVGPIGENDRSAANYIEQFRITMTSGDRRFGNRQRVTDAVSGDSTFTKPLDYFGTKTFGQPTDYDRYVTSVANSGQTHHEVLFPQCDTNVQQGRVFVGQRKESFSVNLGEIFDLVNLDPININNDESNNELADKNITTLALEIHKNCLKGNGNGVIGGWTTASMKQVRILNPRATFEYPEISGGAWTQVSRLGHPLVNEVIIGLADKNRFNSSEPKEDGQFATFVTHPTLPAIINLLFNGNGEISVDNIAPTNIPRGDLVAAFLTGVAGVTQQSIVTPSEILRLNTDIAPTERDLQSNLGIAAGDLAGFPNGRRPGDDVVDLSLRAVMGAFCHGINIDLSGDGVIDSNDNLLLCGDTPETSAAAAPVGTVPFTDGAPQNAQQFDDRFPYLTTPLPGAGS